MLPFYSEEELNKIYQGLPKPLQDALDNEETTEQLKRISERYDINKAPLFSTLVGRVLMGVLHPDDLPKIFGAELGLRQEVIKNINHEVRRFILAPVKNELSELYRFEFTPVPKPIEAPREKPKVAPPAEAPGQDVYREPVE